MSIEDYEALSPDDKFRIALTEGQFMDHKINGAVSKSLYAVDKFFVEVHYNISQNKVLGQSSFVSGYKLNRHTSFKDIEGVDVMEPEVDEEANRKSNEYLKNYFNIVNGKPYNSDLLSNEDRLLGENHRFRREMKEMKELHKVEIDEINKKARRQKAYIVKPLFYFFLFIMFIILIGILEYNLDRGNL